jgi:hypothetical protein
LAQSLRLQIDNQLVTLQNQALATASAGAAASSKADSQASAMLTAMISDIKNGAIDPTGAFGGLTPAQISTVLQQDGPGKAYQLMATYAGGEQNLDSIMNKLGVQTNGQPVNPITALYAIANYGYQSAMAATEQIADPYTKQSAVSKINDAMANDKINVGGSKFTLTELADVANNIAAGTNKYSLVQTDKGLQINENPAIDYQIKYDQNGNQIPTTDSLNGTPNVYGTSATQGTDLGYPAVNPATGKPYDVLYKYDAKSGAMNAIPFDAKNYDKSGNAKTMKDVVTKDQLLTNAGFVKSANGNLYTATDQSLIKQMKEMGIDVQNLSSDNFIVDSTGHIKFKVGSNDIYQLVTDRGADNNPITHVYKVEASGLNDFLGGRTPSATTTEVLGNKMLANLQTDVNGAAFQGGNMNLVQHAGTSGILQQAATAQQLNTLKAEQLRVANTPVAPAITVQPYAPPAPIKVQQTLKQYPIQVVTPQAPALVVQKAPTTAMTSSGSIQGGTVNLQGSSPNLQSNGNMFQNGYSGSLRVI